MTQLLKSAVLLEGITHLEDLSLREFIRTVETLKDKIVTEKLDGANLWFGLDENGVFTSREGKSPKKSRFYNVDDYAMVAAYNGFRATHLALEAIEPIIKQHFQPGDTAEIEVLFGRQPNTVTYGVNDTNFIVILRAVNDTPDDRVQKLAKALRGKTVEITSTVVSSSDGNSLKQEDVRMKWEFTRVAPLDTKKVDTKEALQRLDQLKSFLKQDNEALAGMTNQDVAELSLTSIPKPEREAAKRERDRVNSYIMAEFKVPIKELLLNNFVRKVKPFLQAHDLDPSEDIGVEGVVIRDPVSGTQTKIVDKDVFTAINVFNTSVRNSIAGLVRTADQDAPAEARGGVFGQAKIRIAELLGAKELAVSSSAKRFIVKFKQADALSTAEALASSLNVTSLPSVRSKTTAILKNAVSEINGILDEFKQEAGEFKLKLKTGKEIGISPEIMKRTLTAFAETKADINKVASAVSKSRTSAELVLALYGRTIESLFSGGDTDVKESFNLIKSLQEEGEGAGDSGAAGTGTGTVTSGGSEAQMANPVGHPSTTQTGAIATYPYKLLKGSKIIQRRKRNFVLPKKFKIPEDAKPINFGEKFGLLKSVNEDWAHVKDMKFATDVDDSANAQSDVEFAQLRNNVTMSTDVSQSDVDRYLDKAHELNDEVDSVTFGMETDDGKIVKVWVNAQQADAFETALAELLGREDDVEEVINLMAGKFDIVDVEWPEGLRNTQTPDEIADVNTADVEIASDQIESDKDSDISANNADETQPDQDTKDQAADEIEAEKDSDIGANNADETQPDQAADEEDEDIFLGATSDEEDEDDDDEEEDEEDEDPSAEGEPEKKKPKLNKEESVMTTFGQRFKNRVLAEEKQKQKHSAKDSKKSDDAEQEDPSVVAARAKHDKQTAELMKTFPTVHQKAIVTLMLSLGAPISAMKIHKADLRDNISSAAEMYRKNSSFRMWANKLLAAITAGESSMAESVVAENERFEKQLTNKYQRVIYFVLQALGLPEAIQTTAARALKNGIRARAALAMEDNDTRIYLMSVADQLGIDEKVRGEPEPAKNVKEDKRPIHVVKEDNSDEALDLLSDLLSTFGFEVNKNSSISTQSRQADSRRALMKLAANPTLMRRLGVIKDMIKDKIAAPATPGLSAPPQLSSVQHDGVAITESNKDTKWVIASMGSAGLTITGGGMKIKLDDDETEKLGIALNVNKKVAVKSSDGTRFVFIPHKKGYIIKDLGDSPTYPEGLHMSKLDADEISARVDLT